MNQSEQNIGFPQEDAVEVVPASPGKRIAAYCLNVVLSVLAYVPLIIAVAWPMRGYADRAEGMDVEQLSQTDWSMPWLLGGALVLLAYALLQLRWMSRNGQSVGKKIMNIRVLKTDGNNPGFVGTVLLREVAFNLMAGFGAAVVGYLAVLLAGLSVEAVEPLANVVSLAVMVACVAMLFNKKKDRRTLQDYLANTVVVSLPKR